MGWWKIDSVGKGQIDMPAKQGEGEPLNAIPGVHTADDLYNGDGPADILGVCCDRIAEMYKAAWGRSPKKSELQAVLNFVVNPFIDDDGYYRRNK